MIRPVERETILMIDGAEKLPWIVHLLLALATPRLVVTAHGRREGLPLLVECAVIQTSCKGSWSSLPARIRQCSRATWLFVEKSGNAREVFAALYDVFAA